MAQPQIERLESAKVFRKALDFVARSRKYPAQLRWATFDYKSFESLVSELSKMNDSLSYFLETGQKMQLLRTQQDTFLQVLQVSNRMDHLFELLSSMTKPESGRMTTKSPEEEEPDIVARATHAEKLMRLAKFKALAVAIETGVTYAGPLLSLPGSSAKFHIDLNLLELADQRPATNRQTRSLAKYGSASVWIEWRYYTPLGIEDGPPAHVVERVTKLVTLLGHDVNPPEFRIPKCYGYVLQLEQQRFGFVFENPNRTSGQIPISLRTRFASDEMPSLTERVEMAVAIAESVWYLHATNWLHKGLRSDNIVFLDANRPAAPSLCGFEYSRPARTGELTERPSFEPRDNFYRHPKAQYDLPTENGREFKKIYDIYSLGVVLLEIGLWAPIETILGITVDEHIEASTIRRIRSDLLEGGYLTRLDAQVGRAYAAATRVCLASDFDIDFGLPDEEVGARLQSEFGDKVIKKLAGISV